jgi:hypothetical protein
MILEEGQATKMMREDTATTWAGGGVEVTIYDGVQISEMMLVEELDLR